MSVIIMIGGAILALVGALWYVADQLVSSGGDFPDIGGGGAGSGIGVGPHIHPGPHINVHSERKRERGIDRDPYGRNW